MIFYEFHCCINIPTKRSLPSGRKQKFAKNVCRLVILLHYFRQVLEVIATARNEDIGQLAETIYQNTEKVFSK